MRIRQYLEGFLSLALPTRCVGCQEVLLEQEPQLCISCQYHLAVKDDHLFPENNTYHRLAEQADIEGAMAHTAFKRGTVAQAIVHKLKYKRGLSIGRSYGKQIGLQLLQAGYAERIDIIVPIPLHKNRLKKRGYNQSEYLAKAIGKILNKPVNASVMIRAVDNESQTTMSKYERFENVDNIFKCLDPSIFAGKHVLLVDDVITTGATIASATAALKSACDCKVSVASLSIAGR